MNARIAIIAVIALAGLTLGWNKGQLPRHAASDTPAGAAADDIAPDLALYRDVIAEVRAGKNYYEVAREQIPLHGFPISSPLNWRLPTYAWVLSRLPGVGWIQAALVVLSIAGLWLAFEAQSRSLGIGYAAVTTFLLFGVVRWAIDGYAFLAQEPWAATLLLVSLGAMGNAEFRTQNSIFSGPYWRWIAVVAGIGALFFRELALPYCLVAGAMAVYGRRWHEAAGWAAGIALFLGFFAWHVSQVKGQLIGTAVAPAADLNQWLRFGGLDFVLLSLRMNSLLFAAPAWLLWIYLLLALVGLSRGRDATTRLACLAALSYVLAFAIFGRPENFYWGLMAAPLLAFGAGRSPAALRELWTAGQSAAANTAACQEPS